MRGGLLGDPGDLPGRFYVGAEWAGVALALVHDVVPDLLAALVEIALDGKALLHDVAAWQWERDLATLDLPALG